MTQQEVNTKTNEKVAKIKALCAELQVTLTAEEILTDKGFLKKVIYYLDNEKYEIDPVSEPEAKA